MQLVLLVALGGAIGSVGRYLIGLHIAARYGSAYPWATLTVNVVGAFVMGLVVEWIARRLGGSAEARALLASGLLGGFTTFSAFAYDVSVLVERGGWIASLGYVLLSVIGSILALYAGLVLARTLLP